MADMFTDTLYRIEPQVLTETSQMLQDTVRTMSLSMQNIPVERSLAPIQQMYEWRKKNLKTGIGYEMDVISPPDVYETLTKVEKPTPIAFFNKALTYDEYRRESLSAYSLNERLQDHLGQLALRIDIFNYIGDTKHAIDNLISATPGTEFGTQLDVSTTALATTTMETAIKQLKASLQYSGLISKQSTVILEVTVSLWEQLSVKSTNEDFNALAALEQQLRASFSANSRVVENHLLDATVTIDTAGRHTIVLSTNNKAVLYVADPRIMKIVQSPLEIRQSPLDPTKGITFQPAMRTRRIDVEPLGVLVETAAAV